MMLKVVNLHQKPRKNRSQRKLELKYQGKYPQNRTKNHSTNPMPFFLARPTEKLYRNGLDIVTFQTVKQNLQDSRFFFGNKKLVFTVQAREGHFRNFWVGMCRWDPGTLNLYQS